jgi:hypothetical protein
MLHSTTFNSSINTQIQLSLTLLRTSRPRNPKKMLTINAPVVANMAPELASKMVDVIDVYAEKINCAAQGKKPPVVTTPMTKSQARTLYSAMQSLVTGLRAALVSTPEVEPAEKAESDHDEVDAAASDSGSDSDSEAEEMEIDDVVDDDDTAKVTTAKVTTAKVTDAKVSKKVTTAKVSTKVSEPEPESASSEDDENDDDDDGDDDGTASTSSYSSANNGSDGESDGESDKSETNTNQTKTPAKPSKVKTSKTSKASKVEVPKSTYDRAVQGLKFLESEEDTMVIKPAKLDLILEADGDFGRQAMLKELTSKGKKASYSVSGNILLACLESLSKRYRVPITDADALEAVAKREKADESGRKFALPTSLRNGVSEAFVAVLFGN